MSILDIPQTSVSGHSIKNIVHTIPGGTVIEKKKEQKEFRGNVKPIQGINLGSNLPLGGLIQTTKTMDEK